ncbi:hypothetical protein HBA54_24665 [Pelagibius litoralis]|uniref:Oxidase n=1 Tax=Pelagibius litoralis TaxID=374515 RepID=A0A967F259_9PROT|nr:hypothetical protein [Pelagibius litoralis]NIA71793.1 hypothetical protein [Pelagibius litoralis]
MSLFPLRGPRGEAALGEDHGLSATATTALIVAAVFVGAVLLVALLALQTRVPFPDLTRDPLAIMGKKSAPHLGFLSNLGALLWCTTAAVCAFVGLRLMRDRDSRRRSLFLFAVAGFSAVLLFDDLFMVHENLKLRMAHGDIALFVVYGISAFCYIGAFRGVLSHIGVFAPLLAVALLGVSVAADVAKLTDQVEGTWPWVLEDGSKFVGIALWTAFHLRAAWILDAGRRLGHEC